MSKLPHGIMIYMTAAAIAASSVIFTSSAFAHDGGHSDAGHNDGGQNDGDRNDGGRDKDRDHDSPKDAKTLNNLYFDPVPNSELKEHNYKYSSEYYDEDPGRRVSADETEARFNANVEHSHDSRKFCVPQWRSDRHGNRYQEDYCY